MMLTPRTYLAKRKSRWPCDACVIHARFARDEIINLAVRRFARNKPPSDFKLLFVRKLRTLFQKYKLQLTAGIHACIGYVFA